MLALAAGPTPMWYATRASGYTALVLLSATVVLGLLTSSRQSTRDWPRFVVQSIHRNLSLLVVVFLLIHIVTSVIDPFAKLTVLDAVVPFVATYRPLWLGLGVVSLELLIAITATSLLRHRLGWRTWQVVHMLAYVSWPVAVVHGVGTGTDTKSVWALLVVTACVATVVGALIWRLAGGWPRLAALRVAGIGAGVIATAALVAWIATGPLQPGWAKAAGTPADLLSGAGTATIPPAPTLAAGLDDQLTGSIAESATTVVATLADARDSTLQLVIVANQDGSGNLTVTRAGATICSARATIGTDSASGQCGRVQVDIQLVAGTGRALGGTLVTRQVAG